MRRRKPKLPPIRVWTEPVDDGCIAVLATCFKVRPGSTKENGKWVRRPFLYGFTKFFLTDHSLSRWRREELAVEHITAIAAESDNYLPRIGPCSDMPGWGDYE